MIVIGDVVTLQYEALKNISHVLNQTHVVKIWDHRHSFIMTKIHTNLCILTKHFEGQ